MGQSHDLKVCNRNKETPMTKFPRYTRNSIHRIVQLLNGVHGANLTSTFGNFLGINQVVLQKKT